MIKIYKKCEKTMDNPTGAVELTNLKSYDKPFLLCISPQELIDKSVFGIIKEGARAARVRTSDEFAGGFKIDEMPVDFLGIKNDLKDKNNFDLVDDFLYPYLKKGTDIKLQARKINVFAYCNGTYVYVEIENKLKNKLLNAGYSAENVKEILSQISVISVASEVDLSNTYATSILFKDVNDTEVFDKVSKVTTKKMNELARNTYAGYIDKEYKHAIFTFNGTGEHDLKEYFKEENFVKSSLCAVVSFVLNNSVQNTNSYKLMPINGRMLLQYAMRYNNEFEDMNALLNKLDQEITYNVAPKYTKEEEKYLKELEKIYLRLAKAEILLQTKEIELEKESKDKRLLISEIKDKCSDIAFNQIVVNNGFWNNTKDNIDYNSMKTDRMIREEYEKSYNGKSL